MFPVLTSESLPFDMAPRPRQVPWGTGISVALHASLALLLLLVSPLPTLIVPPPQPVTVRMVTPAEIAALTQPKPIVQPKPVAQPAPVAPPAPLATPTPAVPEAQSTDRSQARLPAEAPPDTSLTEATTLYSGALLASPSMRRIRQTLTTLADSEQANQLCNIEGLEQLKRAEPDHAADTLVPYAMGDVMQTGLSLVATGGAFRSRKHWFTVSYTCTVAPDMKSVTAFAFRIGVEIPPSEWDAHDLNEADEDE